MTTLQRKESMEQVHFTPTEQRMLKVLSDGLPHSKEELFTCLVDELGELKNLSPHITSLRHKLKRKGHGLVLEQIGVAKRYRQVILLNTRE